MEIAHETRLVRRFEKLQLLLHVLSTTIDALKLLFFLISIIASGLFMMTSCV